MVSTSHIQPGSALPVQRPRRGVIWISEGYDQNQELIERPIYMMPGQDYGLTQEQLFSVDKDLQVKIMESWFRRNYYPASVETQSQLGSDASNHPLTQLGLEFGDSRTGDVLGGRELPEKLRAEAVVWLPRPPRALEASRAEALATLDALEAAIKVEKDRLPGIGDNHPPEPINDTGAAPIDANEYALSAIIDGRAALTPQAINQSLAQQAVRKLIYFGAAISEFLSKRLQNFGKEFEAEFWKQFALSLAKNIAVVAVGSITTVVTGTLVLLSVESSLLGKVVNAIRAIQQFINP